MMKTINIANLDDLIPKFTSITGAVNSKLDNLVGDVEPKRDTHYSDLDPLPALFSGAADSVNLELDGVGDGINDKISEHYDNYKDIIPYYLPYAKRTNDILENLQTGAVPADWQSNMEKSINLAMQNTIGKVVNDHASRGGLNSSVTTEALYDIERNAADEVARQYHQNIQFQITTTAPTHSKKN